MAFADRTEAGRRLAAALTEYRGRQPVVLALPRGGVPVGAVIADALAAPLDLVLVRKVGVPYQPELAMGAVVDGGTPIVVRNEDVLGEIGISPAEFDAACQREMKEIERRRQQYLGGREPIAVAGSAAIVVDDGIATGATTIAALRAVRMRQPRHLVVAAPVAPADTLARLADEADHVVCLETPAAFGAISMYYADFRQISDEEVIALLASARTGRDVAS